MNKEQFLAALRARLTGLPREDLERTLQYYREMIDDRIEEGMSEQAAVADVGDPDELAAAILQRPVRRTQMQTAKASAPMSAGKRAALIVCAVLLIIAGISLILGATNMMGGSAVEREYTFANSGIRALEIESGSAGVDLYRAKDGIIRVQCVESATMKYKIWQNEETLHIERERAGRWSLFHVSMKEDHIQIYLPEQDYESLWIKSSSGGIGIPEGFRFDNAIITVSSGGVAFAADAAGELNIRTSSGGVAVKNASPENLFISASSGGVALSGMAPGRVSLNSTSGSLKLDGIRCGGDLSAEVSSGSIRLSDVITDGAMTLECTSGSIKLDDCDAAELHIRSTSGSVSGHLLTPKIYSASAVSGSVRVPTGGSGGICDVKTTSGSIHFD